MTRRSLIQRALLLLGIDPVGLIGCVSRQAAGGASPPLRAPDPTSTLSSAAMEDLVAFGEVLVEGRTLVPAERRYLVEHIEDRIQGSARHLSLYRTMVSTLERLAGRPFASLDIRERIELVARHGLGVAPVPHGDDLGPAPMELRTLPARTVVRDLIGGYYGSPAGWAVVGYQTFPGRCGDLTRYTRPES